jgi:hypothetical protein
MEPESDTTQFVKRMSSVPVPEDVFSWVDIAWHRSFLILKAFKGQTLDRAWGSLSTERRVHIADTIAEYCKELSLMTSERLMTQNGSAIREQFLIRSPPNAEPSWRPWIMGPCTPDQLKSYLSGSTQGWYGHIGLFYFKHADLGPTNIIVSEEDASIVGVIDWESAAYYPKLWLGTKPGVSAGFYLQGADDRKAWATLLGQRLERQGLPQDIDAYRMWRKAIRE